MASLDIDKLSIFLAKKISTSTSPGNQTLLSGGEKLPFPVINGVKKFVIFVGNSRSGSSILGSLMDAHPHVVIANEWEFPDFTAIPLHNLKEELFATLYSASLAKKKLNSSIKGYTLEVTDMWQANCDRYIDVIGDKSAGREIPYITDTAKFQQCFHVLQRNLKIPILAIHLIRNPFDIIAAWAVIDHSSVNRSEGIATFTSLKQALNVSNSSISPNSTDSNSVIQFNEPEAIDDMTDKIFRYFRAAEEVAEEVIGKKNVLQVHNCDLVHDPKGTILKVFNFLEVNVTELALLRCVCSESV